MKVQRSGYDLLNSPLFNKGTAFTDEERERFGLHGLLPPSVATLDEQVGRRLQAFRNLSSDYEKHVFLRGLQDSNEVLFFALLVRHIEEMLPIVYTPTVGHGCQAFSHNFWKPRGLFLSIPYEDHISRILSHPHFDDVEVIVVTDGERILGLGDQGAGGMGISIGKLSLYTGCGGIHPATTLPIFLDVGTDNPERLSDPLYIGWRHERVRGQEYDDFIEAFVAAVTERWGHVLLQWEDFARSNATRLLVRYRDRLCTFNDDVQGTAVVAAGALLATANVTGVPIRDQRIAVVGAGGAGSGISLLLLQAMIAEGLSEAEARSTVLLDRPRWAARRGNEGPDAFSATLCPTAKRDKRVEARTGGFHQLGRRRSQCAADGAHRCFRSARRLSGERCARHGRNRRSAGDFSIIESEFARRGNSSGSHGVDGW